MKVLLHKLAHYICEINRFGGRTPGYHELPSEIFLCAEYLARSGIDVEVKNQFPSDAPVDFGDFDLVVCWVPLLDGLYDGLANLREAKQAGAVTTLVLNDSYPGTEAQIMNENPFVDYVLRRWNRELGLLELTKHLRSGNSGGLPVTDGVMFRDGAGDVVTVPERPLSSSLDHLGSVTNFLGREDLGRYNEYFILTGLGCPHHCHFCHVRENPSRKRNIDHIIQELAMLPRGARVHMGDTLFFSSVKFAKELCQRIVDENIDIRWNTEVRADEIVHKITNRISFDLLRRAGLEQFNIGVESFHQRILDAIDKRETVETMLEGIELALSSGITPYLNMLLGHPLDSHETLQTTYDTLKALPEGICFGIQKLRPISGVIIQEFLDEGILDAPLTVHDVAMIKQNVTYRTKYLSEQEIEDWHERFRQHANYRWLRNSVRQSKLPHLAREAFARRRIAWALKTLWKEFRSRRPLVRE